MATDERTSARKRRNSQRIRYFYLNSDLHRVLRVIRAEDFVEAWNYREGKTYTYVWSDVRKRMENAFTLVQAGEMINRHRVQIENYILQGKIRTPQRAYSLDGKKVPGKYLMSESDVLELHSYLLTVHRGRPRKDGRITPSRMPSKAELKALMRHDTMMYVKTASGDFTQVWKEVDW